MERVQYILEFWFGDTRHDLAAVPGRMKFWFSAGADLDEPIGRRFADDVTAAASGELEGWNKDPEGRLAAILLLDQFTRNIYRGKREAFASDDEALAMCQAGIDAGHDTELGPAETAFFYMPMQHAESLAIQDRSIELFDALAASVPPAAKGIFQNGFARYARLHRDIIARFGRFPHRNAILGRMSTPEEKAYLAGDAPTFGQ